jgi:hypothetical protein
VGHDDFADVLVVSTDMVVIGGVIHHRLMLMLLLLLLLLMAVMVVVVLVWRSCMKERPENVKTRRLGHIVLSEIFIL